MTSSISGLGSSQNLQQMMSMMGTQQKQSLTDEQKQEVADILSNYDADNITEEDAQEIFAKFKEAGIEGAGLKEAIEEAGFDAENLRELGMPDEEEMQGPPPPGFGQGISTSGSAANVDIESLKTLQDILDQYDLSNLTEDQQTELTAKLQQSGLLSEGSLFNLTA